MTIDSAPPNFAAIKERQRATWASGDYGAIGATLQLMAEQLCESVGLRAGDRVLDVACGTGNAALAAARRSCDAWAADYVPSLLERARERAAAERLAVTVREADAEALPFEDGAFDAVLSVVGVMFAPNQEQAAAELVRVCRPGGKVGLACWTPDGFVGQVLRVIGGHVPPPPGLRPPTLWGTEARLRELFGDRVSAMEIVRRRHIFRYRSPRAWLETFRAAYGPMLKAFEALDAAGRERLAADLLALAQRFNESGDETLAAPAEYLDVVLVTQRAAGPDRAHPSDWR